MKGIFQLTESRHSYIVPKLEIYEFPEGSDVFLTLSEEEKNDNENNAGDMSGFID